MGKCRDSGWDSSGAYIYHYVLMCMLGLYFVIWPAVKKNVERTVEKFVIKMEYGGNSIGFSQFDWVSEML